jgi:hypothetical protein
MENAMKTEIEKLKADVEKLQQRIAELEKPQELTRENGMKELNEKNYWLQSDGVIRLHSGKTANDFDLFNSFNTKEEAKTERDYTLASRRVRAWAKAVNGGKSLNWENERQVKWGVTFVINNFRIDCYRTNNHFIHQICFPTEELATKFLQLFRPELEILSKP